MPVMHSRVAAGSFKIDHELKVGRLLNTQFGTFSSQQYSVDIVSRSFRYRRRDRTPQRDRGLSKNLPDDPKAITISIDSNDTQSVAESFLGPIVFRSQ